MISNKSLITFMVSDPKSLFNNA